MKFAQPSSGVWIFGAYRVERQGTGVDQRFTAMFHDEKLMEGSREKCLQVCADHRRDEIFNAFETAWNKLEGA